MFDTLGRTVKNFSVARMFTDLNQVSTVPFP